VRRVTIADLSSDQVTFVTHRARLPDALWVRDGFYAAEVADPRSRFSAQFAYLIRDSETFHGLDFTSEQRLQIAERYGGEGTGDNGGGARCGNLGGYQVKGIGANPLVGSGRNHWYSYGGLNAQDAIYETIMSEVLGRVLPHGAATIFGVILTAGVRSWSVISACARAISCRRARLRGRRTVPPACRATPRACVTSTAACGACFPIRKVSSGG
jgi:hypothetical protein